MSFFMLRTQARFRITARTHCLIEKIIVAAVSDGPFKGQIEAGIVGGAEGFAEHVRDRGEAVGETLCGGGLVTCSISLTWHRSRGGAKGEND
ncbi:hypothetical protein ACOSOMT5_P1008 [Acidiphilium sp. MT5]